ncbi:3-deoxy-7-phosphoheptulonate synthase, partial [bacterium]|nr:3-deoxy-7-phosphoheptulonate synthase [bacterium]
LKILLQMSVILTYGVRKTVVRIGRLAGQYAKPRSRDFEVIDGRELPAYRGDNVNSIEPTALARTPDPNRLLSSFYYSAMTLNHVRALIDGGFADLHHPHNWNLHSIEKSHNWDQYEDVVNRILDAINFMESFGGVRAQALGRIDFFTSHEGLLLGYEEAMTHRDADSGHFYNHGAHMLWIGNRTRDLDGAHVEFFRGIANPIGVKVDADLAPEEVVALARALNPLNEEGRITLITRMGDERIADTLPPLIRAVRKDGCQVVWSCDPMHGNTQVVNDDVKTRDFGLILHEVGQAFRIHQDNRTYLAGVHFELTGEDVTECIGGGAQLTRQDLASRYETACDPRLNYSQSLEMAFRIATELKRDAGSLLSRPE